MKINEKNLSAYAVSATTVDKEGYLNKRGEVNKNFQRRYFLLKGNLLFYFDKRGDKDPLGVIILEGCTIELAEDEEQFCFKILFHGTNNRTYILGSETQETMEQWMKALACSSYDYMKLMVAELQRQLDDIEETPIIPVPVDVLKKNQQPKNGSPIAPPRTRHNPFNNNKLGGENSAQNRASNNNNNMRNSTNNNNQNKIEEIIGKSSSSSAESSSTTTTTNNHYQNKISFRELHNSYGRPILQDYNIWKREQRNISDNSVANLISF